MKKLKNIALAVLFTLSFSVAASGCEFSKTVSLTSTGTNSGSGTGAAANIVGEKVTAEEWKKAFDFTDCDNYTMTYKQTTLVNNDVVETYQQSLKVEGKKIELIILGEIDEYIIEENGKIYDIYNLYDEEAPFVKEEDYWESWEELLLWMQKEFVYELTSHAEDYYSDFTFDEGKKVYSGQYTYEFYGEDEEYVKFTFTGDIAVSEGKIRSMTGEHEYQGRGWQWIDGKVVGEIKIERYSVEFTVYDIGTTTVTLPAVSE